MKYFLFIAMLAAPNLVHAEAENLTYSYGDVAVNSGIAAAANIGIDQALAGRRQALIAQDSGDLHMRLFVTQHPDLPEVTLRNFLSTPSLQRLMENGMITANRYGSTYTFSELLEIAKHDSVVARGIYLSLSRPLSARLGGLNALYFGNAVVGFANIAGTARALGLWAYQGDVCGQDRGVACENASTLKRVVLGQRYNAVSAPAAPAAPVERAN